MSAWLRPLPVMLSFHVACVVVFAVVASHQLGEPSLATAPTLCIAAALAGQAWLVVRRPWDWRTRLRPGGLPHWSGIILAGLAVLYLPLLSRGRLFPAAAVTWADSQPKVIETPFGPDFAMGSPSSLDAYGSWIVFDPLRGGLVLIAFPVIVWFFLRAMLPTVGLSQDVPETLP